MSRYEALLKEVPIILDDCAILPDDYSGLYIALGRTEIILIDKAIKSRNEKACILAEELGHYHTTTGNILDLSDVRNRKQEKRARNWAYEKLIPLQSLVKASKEGIRSRYALAEYLEVTEEFLSEAINRYQEKYGLYVEWTGYIIYFDPLRVIELFEE